MTYYLQHKYFDGINNIAGIKQLYIKSNDLCLLKENPDKVSSITSLYVKKIANDNSYVPHFPNLETLTIDGGSVDISPDNKSLEAITLSGCLYPSMRELCCKTITIRADNIEWSYISESVEHLSINSNSSIPNGVLSRFKNLKRLSISWMDMSGYDLNTLPHVSSLKLVGTKITDISFVEDRPELKKLDISENKVVDLSPLSRLSLTTFKGSKIKAKGFSILRNMTSMINLDVSHNSIMDISFVERMSSLKRFCMKNNSIVFIDILERCVSLETLDISYNPIFDVRVMNRLPKLVTVCGYHTYAMNYDKLKDKDHIVFARYVYKEASVDDCTYEDQLYRYAKALIKTVEPTKVSEAEITSTLGQTASKVNDQIYMRMKHKNCLYRDLLERAWTIIKTNDNKGAIIKILKLELDTYCERAVFFRTLCTVLPFADLNVEPTTWMIVRDAIIKTADASKRSRVKEIEKIVVEKLGYESTKPPKKK